MMSKLSEIEAAIDQLALPQQQELHAYLEAKLANGRLKGGLTPEEFEAWYKTAYGAGIPGITTDEIMAMTRGEE